MQMSLKRGSSYFLAAALCFGIAVLPRGERLADADGDYYASVMAAGGEELLGQLHDLITTTHTYYTSYNDCKNPDYVKRTDPGPNGQLMEFYAQAELSSNWESGAAGTWNREHVWCKSHSNGLWGTSGGGSDLLHIRPTEERVNSARGNDLYGEVATKTPVWYRDKSNTQIAVAGYSVGTVFEPKDEVKGDVARIVMYMYTHYNTYRNVGGTTNGNGASYYFGTLRFSSIMSPSKEDEAIGLLLKWNALDPPDGLEAARNEAAEEIQGNRNPFVDHPEYAEAIWGSTGGQGGDQGGEQGGDQGGDQGGEQDRAALEAFEAAFGAIVTAGTPEARRASLERAIAAYRLLSEAEKDIAKADIQALQREIEAYNEAVGAYNAEGARHNYGALAGAGGLMDGGQA